MALVKIRRPQDIEDHVLEGVAETLTQLRRLGLLSVIVLDLDVSRETFERRKDAAMIQAYRLVSAINRHAENGARVVEGSIGTDSRPNQLDPTRSSISHVAVRKLLMNPLQHGIIPVLPSISHVSESNKTTFITSNDVVMALLRDLAALNLEPMPDEDPVDFKARLLHARSGIQVDRLIILDPLGGIPTDNFSSHGHVFLNMQQQYERVCKDLQSREPKMTACCLSARDAHLANLQLIHDVLSLLPPSSSALLTSPLEAANLDRPSSPFQPAEVGTRRQRNALIHNLLTDKPVSSPSLPQGRSHTSPLRHPVLPPRITTTFAKHGMPVTIYPPPSNPSWIFPSPQDPPLSLTAPPISLPRLINLIEDSFGRKLDVAAYLARIAPRLAGVIIAGEYEGGALLTWELPAGVPDDGSESSRRRMVPYLDKFAVLKRSQGTGGVADIVWRALVGECFPQGVVWRSRKDNPVNKCTSSIPITSS